jgi:hypothetical protein
LPYARTKSFNGKDGWIIGTSSGKGTFDNPVKIDEDVESADPSTVEKAPRWDGEKIIMDETGANIQPEPDEARAKILSVAKNNLSWDQSKIRSLRNNQNTNLFFDYLVEGNYQGAKGEIDWIVNNTDLIDSNEGQTFKNALDGKL